MSGYNSNYTGAEIDNAVLKLAEILSLIPDLATKSGLYDVGGKILLTRLPNSIVLYKSVWNAETNTPELTSVDPDKKGWFYKVSVAGTQFGIDFNLGDWAIYSDDGILEKSDNSDEVTLVNGQKGVVTVNSENTPFTPVTESLATISKVAGKLFLGNDGQIKQCNGSDWVNKWLNPDAYPMYSASFSGEFEFGEHGTYQSFDVGGGVYDWNSYSPHAITFHMSPGQPSATSTTGSYLISIGADGSVWHTFDGGISGSWYQLIDYSDPPEMAFAQTLNQLQFTMGQWYYAYAPDGAGGYLWGVDEAFTTLYNSIKFEKDFVSLIEATTVQGAVVELYQKLKYMIDSIS